MQFGLSPEQMLLRDSLDDYLGSQAPLERVRRFAESNEGRAEDLASGVAELGASAVLIPETYGGLGLSPVDACVFAEAFGYHATPVAYCATAGIVPAAVLAAGSDAQKEKWLPKLASGELIVGAALSEHSGSRNAQVTAREGKLSGRALFVIDADADAYLVADSQAGLHWVAADAAGLKRVALPTIDRTRPVAELVFDGVSAEPLPGSNAAVIQRALTMGRLLLAADTLGAAQHMLDKAVAYAGERKQFDRLIGSFQAVKHMCADMAAALEPTRSFVWYAAHAVAEGSDDADLAVCQLKAHLAEVARQVAKTATEVHGGMGFTDLLGLHYWFKRIGLNRQLLGSPEWLRRQAAQLQGLVATG